MTGTYPGAASDGSRLAPTSVPRAADVAVAPGTRFLSGAGVPAGSSAARAVGGEGNELPPIGRSGVRAVVGGVAGSPGEVVAPVLLWGSADAGSARWAGPAGETTARETTACVTATGDTTATGETIACVTATGDTACAATVGGASPQGRADGGSGKADPVIAVCAYLSRVAT
ncbi:hypothetical protein GCM10009560_18340 [Nonomuraea longicatena]|uniref:Uncharacterized protein n=1 Tax=Nonomuraea longicatena TaxID=83682 RepID=A0ABN1NZQ9_9ACTN